MAGRKRVEVEIVATDEASPKLEQVEKKMNAIEADPVTIKADTTGLDNLGRSADSSKSVLANMVGNATQDLGALGGVAGSAGVAIGQMGEYMVDASNSGDKLSNVFSNFATVAGPIAGIALAMKTITDVQARFAASQERTAASQERWNEALTQGGDAAENYAAALAETGEITLDLTRTQSALDNVLGEITSKWYLGGAGVGALAKALGVTNDETKELTATFAAAGITAEQFTSAVTGSDADRQRFIDAVHNTTLSVEEQTDVIKLLTQEVDNYTEAQKRAADFAKVFNQGQPGTVFGALGRVAAMPGVQAAGIVNNIYNTLPRAESTYEQLNTFVTRNSMRTGG